MKRKVPYERSMRRRLDVSKDPFSGTRVRGLKEAARRLADLPGAIAFSVYGSLSKGKVLTEQTTPLSDIDMFVWIDTDDIASNIDAITSRTDFVEWSNRQRRLSGESSQMEIPEGQMQLLALQYVQERIHRTIRRSVQDQHASDVPPWDDIIDVRFMSEEDVTQCVRILEDLMEYDDYVAALSDPGGADETDGWKWYHEEDTPDQLEQMVWRIKGLFALGVGGGLQHFQQMFVEELVDYFDDRSSRAWDTLVQTLGAERGKFTVHQQLPQTLDEALKAYGSKRGHARPE